VGGAGNDSAKVTRISPHPYPLRIKYVIDQCGHKGKGDYLLMCMGYVGRFLMVVLFLGVIPQEERTCHQRIEVINV
jgi:hypothetical protein